MARAECRNALLRTMPPASEARPTCKRGPPVVASGAVPVVRGDVGIIGGIEGGVLLLGS